MTQGISKSEQVYRALHQGIIDGKYTPGYRFVLDRIARDMGFSPVPVREAVRRMEAEGLVTFERNVGAVVSEINKDDYANAMESVAILEGYATALSAPRLTTADRKKAYQVNQKMRECLNSTFNPKTVTELNQQFHRILTKKCPNHRLLELLEKEWERVSFIRRSQFAFNAGNSVLSVDEHDQILQAIENKQESQVIEELARAHKLRSMRHYITANQ